jgi:hypothetical protein
MSSASRTACFGAEQAHLLADELHLAALAFKVGDALGFGQAIDQFVGQGQALHQVAAQGQQVCAELLQFGAFAFEFGAAGAIKAAFELALVLQVEFAAFGNELTTDEIAFFGFTGHDWGNSFSEAALWLGGKYHSGHCGPGARHFFRDPLRENFCEKFREKKRPRSSHIFPTPRWLQLFA